MPNSEALRLIVEFATAERWFDQIGGLLDKLLASSADGRIAMDDPLHPRLQILGACEQIDAAREDIAAFGHILSHFDALLKYPGFRDDAEARDMRKRIQRQSAITVLEAEVDRARGPDGSWDPASVDVETYMTALQAIRTEALEEQRAEDGGADDDIGMTQAEVFEIADLKVHEDMSDLYGRDSSLSKPKITYVLNKYHFEAFRRELLAWFEDRERSVLGAPRLEKILVAEHDAPAEDPTDHAVFSGQGRPWDEGAFSAGTDAWREAAESHAGAANGDSLPRAPEEEAEAEAEDEAPPPEDGGAEAEGGQEEAKGGGADEDKENENEDGLKMTKVEAADDQETDDEEAPATGAFEPSTQPPEVLSLQSTQRQLKRRLAAGDDPMDSIRKNIGAMAKKKKKTAKKDGAAKARSAFRLTGRTEKRSATQVAFDDIGEAEDPVEDPEEEGEEEERRALQEQARKKKAAKKAAGKPKAKGGRKRWSMEEMTTLIEGVEKLGEGNWALIKAAYDLGGRSNVDLKDKWRNMLDRFKKTGSYY